MRTRRPGPPWWTWYAFGGKLPDRYREWVMHDVTCRTWALRHVARSLVQVTPVAILLLVLLGPSWITYLGLAGGAIMALIYSVAYIEETGEHRLAKHGYPVGTGREVRMRRSKRAADEEHYNAVYRFPES
ncbi:MAG: DUF5313 family protein [Pseudonocardiaceae bacterium]